MSSRLNPLVSGMVKNEIVRFAKIKQVYNMKAPPIPRVEMMVGPIFTDKNREMLSKIPSKPEPNPLISAGRSSPIKHLTRWG